MSSPLFSIVTVVLNCRDGIRTTIRSVIDQDFRDFEYVIIDGGSTDGTVELVREYGDKIMQMVSESDGGIYDAFNKGIARTCGQYVLLLNSGDHLEPGVLAKVAAAVDSSPDRAAVICGGIRVMDGKTLHELGSVVRDASVLENRHRYMFLNHPATFISRQTYERMGPYDTRFRIAGDYEFAQRLLSQGIKIRFIPDIVTVMYTGGISSTFSWTHVAEYFRIVRQYAGTGRAILGLMRFFPGVAWGSMRARIRAASR